MDAVVVLQDVDSLSESAQHALRRSLETHASSLKFFLIANEVQKLSAPLRSRCLGIRVPLPSVDSQVEALLKVAQAESVPVRILLNSAPAKAPPRAVATIAQGRPRICLCGFCFVSSQVELVPPQFLRETVQRCGRNQRRALLALQQVLTQNFSCLAVSGNQGILSGKTAELLKYGAPGGPFPSPWEGLVDDIAAKLAGSPSVRTLQEVRGMFYDVLAALIPPELILARLVQSLFFVKPQLVPPDTGALLDPFPGKGQEKELGKCDSSAVAVFREQRPLRLLVLQVTHEAAAAALGVQRGSKAIVHLEAFAANAMRRFKAYAEQQQRSR